MRNAVILFFILVFQSLFSQGVGINPTGTPPHPSAILDLQSSQKGFLPPRLTTAERDAINAPALGLVIFNITTQCLNFFIGTGWNEICGAPIMPIGNVLSLNCNTAIHNGTLTQSSSASNVNSQISYTGGNGGTYTGQTVFSTGVTGLTASLAPGNLLNGSGNITYTITGTPNGSGTAFFLLSFCGQSCTLTRTVLAPPPPTYPSNAVFCASGPTAIVDVINPITGKTWMDRNLGATQVASSVSDVNSYGDLYQWGRRSDGHQCRTSATTNVLSSIDQPAHGSFILNPNSPFNWLISENSNLWQGVNGVNNPCPGGYRLPTETELSAEISSWSSPNSAGAIASPLKWSAGGYRVYTNGSFWGAGAHAYYWTSTVVNSSSIRGAFNSSVAGSNNADLRGFGFSVRCIKN